MLERKYGDRSNWKCVIERNYVQSFMNTKEFKGYMSLIKVAKQPSEKEDKMRKKIFLIPSIILILTSIWIFYYFQLRL
jgi:hypothetical protein